MYEFEMSISALKLDYEKVLQKYQVVLGFVYSLPLGAIGLLFTTSTSQTTILLSAGMLYILGDSKRKDIEEELNSIKVRIITIENEIRKRSTSSFPSEPSQSSSQPLPKRPRK